MFAINVALLPSCDNFESAVKIYCKAARFSKADTAEGLSETHRGLRTKRDYTKVVYGTPRGGVVFRYHADDMVLWLSPIRIQVRTYNSPSSVAFANQFLPRGVYTHLVDGVMRVNGMAPRGAGGVEFEKVGNDWVANPGTVIPEYQHRVNRSVAYRAYKILNPFLEWHESLTALKNGSRSARLNCSPYDRAPYFREMAQNRELSDSSRMQLHELCRGISSDELRREFLAVVGAVEKVALPIGTPPKKTPWDTLIYGMSAVPLV